MHKVQDWLEMSGGVEYILINFAWAGLLKISLYKKREPVSPDPLFQI